jgi:hypothetical protein
VPRARSLRLLIPLAALAAGACATTPWPDELGKPVPVSLSGNVETGDQFLDALTSARQKRGLPAPDVPPRYQAEIRKFAEDLQEGRTSAAGALRAIRIWGQAVYEGPVDAWVLDCGGGHPPQLPEPLVGTPAAVISYAAARFRPASLATDQCGLLVVARKG